MSTPAPQAADPYLWLEEIDGQRALDWVRGENARSLAALHADPRFARLKQDALAIVNDQRRLALGSVRNGFVYNFWQDETHVRGLWRRTPVAAYEHPQPAWETLLDLDQLSAAEGKNWVYQGVVCLPPQNTRCLISLSDGGKDARVVREFDLATKRFVEGGFALPEAKSEAVWKDQDTLYVATDWGPGSLSDSGYPIVIKEWRRGTPLSAAREVFSGETKDVASSVAAMTRRDGGMEHFIVRAETFFTAKNYHLVDGQARLMTMPGKATLRGVFGEHLLFTIEESWTPPGATRALPSGALLSTPLAQATRATPQVEIAFAPGDRESFEDLAVTRDGVLLAVYRNVTGRLMRLTRGPSGWALTEIPTPANGAVSLSGADPTDGHAFVVTESFLSPDTLNAVDSAKAVARPFKSLPAQFDAARFDSAQYEAVSSDGTKIPYFVLSPKNLPRDGNAPTLLYGYGGFQVSLTPAYSPFMGKLWLERGGVYVLANIRGGGEFGPEWHQAGLKTHRQIVYDDFIAVAEDLAARKITSPRRLGIMGGSNGGLLMGVMLTQRPGLFNAAVVQVPLLDMLRYDQLLAGASWVDEYGSPAVPEERAFLEKLSPYQNLKKRDDMPTPLFVTSTKDDRVHPGHARKYAAKMQALGMPFFYYENIDGGHSASANLQEQAERRALEMTYLAQRLMD